jgi:hypothetical protein
VNEGLAPHAELLCRGADTYPRQTTSELNDLVGSDHAKDVSKFGKKSCPSRQEKTGLAKL